MKNTHLISQVATQIKGKAAGLLAIAVMALAFASCDQKDLASKVSYVPVKVSQNKWSFVSRDGDLVCMDEFENCPTLVYNGFFSYENEDGYALYKIDNAKKEVVGHLSRLSSVGYMEDGKVPATIRSHRIGVFDTSGENLFEIQPINGKEIVKCNAGFSDGMLMIFDEDGKIGYIDESGKAVIQPIYDKGASFSDGLALVAKYSEDDYDTSYIVIDKSGKTVFKLKADQRPSDYSATPGCFDHGYLIVYDGERDVLYDKDGEFIKFPSGIKRIVKTNGNFIVFKNEDGDYGMANMDGEIIIPASYRAVDFLNSNTFYARDNEATFLFNRKGDVTSTLNYKYSIPFGRFGFFVSERDDRYSLINEKGKAKGKEDFYRVNVEKLSYSKYVETDYIDIEGAAKTIADLISGNNVGPYALGSTPSIVFKSSSPRDFTSRYAPYTLEEIDIKGYRYYISATGEFDNNQIVKATRDYYDYYDDWHYSWNNSSRLYEVDIRISAESEWGKAGFDMVVDQLKSKEFDLVKSGTNEYGYAAMLKKGSVSVFVNADGRGQSSNIKVITTDIYEGRERSDHLESSISTDKTNLYEDTVRTESVVEEVAVVEETAVDYQEAPVETCSVAPAETPAN